MIVFAITKIVVEIYEIRGSDLTIDITI